VSLDLPEISEKGLDEMDPQDAVCVAIFAESR
jgi:hypothetical protein